MAIEHSAADVELPVGCRRSVEAWKAAHCCSEPGERQEASIEATSILKRLRSLRAIVGEVAKCSRANRKRIKLSFRPGKIVKTGQLISGTGCA